MRFVQGKAGLSLPPAHKSPGAEEATQMFTVRACVTSSQPSAHQSFTFFYKHLVSKKEINTSTKEPKP